MTIESRAIALGIAGALALAVTVPAAAGPVFSNTTTVKNAVAENVTDVRWRGRGVGPGIGLGIAAGALVGAAVAGSAYGPNYYYDEPGYAPGYGAPVYAQPYGYGQEYGYEPAYPTRQYYGSRAYRSGQCSTDEGYGRRGSCDGR